MRRTSELRHCICFKMEHSKYRDTTSYSILNPIQHLNSEFLCLAHEQSTLKETNLGIGKERVTDMDKLRGNVRV